MSTLDELIAEIESAPWHRRLGWAAQRRWNAFIRSPRAARRAVVFARQRMTRGWDQRALYSLDSHLAETLGAQLTALARIAHGYPGTYPGGFEGWVADLGRNGAALSAYGAIDNLMPEHDHIWADAREALHWVADHLGALWD